jgi:putative MATE family efflux protein
MKKTSLTEGTILAPLLKFGAPVLLALFLQSLYGAVDLFVVGRFSESADVSGVSTGSQIMMTLTNLVSSFSMGVTIMLGHQIGQGRTKDAGKTIGTGIVLFLIIGVFLSALTAIFASPISHTMQAPAEAFSETVSYVRICGLGFIVIIFYNLIGSIFRGIGDSNTPLVTVAVASLVNIGADLLLVAGFKMGAAGAAIATVFAQIVSVVFSIIFISRRKVPFEFKMSDISFDGAIVKHITKLGLPIALQDLLVGISFLVIMAIVNSLGLIFSAGIGVAEKVCAFIMLVPLSFMQSMSAFVAQNVGAQKYGRATKALCYGIIVSLSFGVIMFFAAFFHGTIFTEIFSKDPEVVVAAAEYLKAYAIDTMLTSFLFCFIGFYNGFGLTRFVMIQGIVGAFCIRIPLSFLASRITPPSLFKIGLATPCSTAVQILLCFGCMIYVKKKFLSKNTAA